MTIAGSDSGGGAGVQADLKTFAAHGVFGTSVVTAVTAQNTAEVRGVHHVDPAFVDLQIDAVLSDFAVAIREDGHVGLLGHRGRRGALGGRGSAPRPRRRPRPRRVDGPGAARRRGRRGLPGAPNPPRPGGHPQHRRSGSAHGRPRRRRGHDGARRPGVGRHRGAGRGGEGGPSRRGPCPRRRPSRRRRRDPATDRVSSRPTTTARGARSPPPWRPTSPRARDCARLWSSPRPTSPGRSPARHVGTSAPVTVRSTTSGGARSRSRPDGRVGRKDARRRAHSLVARAPRRRPARGGRVTPQTRHHRPQRPAEPPPPGPFRVSVSGTP